MKVKVIRDDDTWPMMVENLLLIYSRQHNTIHNTGFYHPFGEGESNLDIGLGPVMIP